MVNYIGIVRQIETLFERTNELINFDVDDHQRWRHGIHCPRIKFVKQIPPLFFFPLSNYLVASIFRSKPHNNPIQSHNFVHYNEPRFETPRFKLYFSTTMRPHKRCYIPLPLRQIYEEKKRKLTLCKIDYESYENKIARTRKLKTYSAFYKSKNA